GEPVASLRTGHDAELVLRCENRSGADVADVDLAIGIDDPFGRRITYLGTDLMGQSFAAIRPGSSEIRVRIRRVPLLPGRYTFTIYCTSNGIVADWVKHAGWFDVEAGDYYQSGGLAPKSQGIVGV